MNFSLFQLFINNFDTQKTRDKNYHLHTGSFNTWEPEAGRSGSCQVCGEFRSSLCFMRPGKREITTQNYNLSLVVACCFQKYPGPSVLFSDQEICMLLAQVAPLMHYCVEVSSF